MNDDFNTPVAVSVLFELASEVNRTRERALARQLRTLARRARIARPRAARIPAAGRGRQQHGRRASTPAAIEAMIAARVAAKQAKDYAEADRIRAELLEAGVALEDKPGGSTEWRRV